MATATMMTPSSYYRQQQQQFSSPFHASAPPTIRSSESRRSASDLEASRQQCLPSLHEVIAGTRPSLYAPTISASAPHAPSSLPPPITTSALPRAYSDVTSESPSPRNVHASTVKVEPIQSPRLDRPSAPHHPSHHQPSMLSPYPPGQIRFPPDRTEPGAGQHQSGEVHQLSAGYPNQPPLPGGGSRPQLGPISVPSYPMSPQQGGPPMTPVFDQRHPTAYGGERGASYQTTVKQAFEAWNYCDNWTTVAESSNIILKVAEAFNATAREQHVAQPIQSRLPTEQEIGSLIDHASAVKSCLEDIRGMVQRSKMDNERTREDELSPGMDGDPAYATAMIKSEYSDTKRRRGRAAPPGRCHSCHRVDTPEWRRGPDGARTLCNACGLHFAKLERKRAAEIRALRLKKEARN